MDPSLAGCGAVAVLVTAPVIEKIGVLRSVPGRHDARMQNDRGPQPTLAGTHVRLRPWRADDVDAVCAACQDAEIQRWTQVPVPYARENAEEFVGNIAPGTWDQGGGLFAVELREGGSLAGSIGLFPPHDGFAEAGYWTGPEHRGRGFTAEALGLLTTWAF